MKRLYIYPNLTEERYINKARHVIDFLNNKGYECIFRKQDSLIIYDKEIEFSDIDNFDVVVSLGGDGTYLRAAKFAIERSKPICGINCGNVGYLCTFNINDLDEIDFNNLIEKEKSLLEFEYDNKKYYSVNEVVIGKDYFGGTVELEYMVKDSVRFKGDGLIICTNTGSTGYNLSAGGEIFKDELIGITPICAHSRSVDPIYVNSDSLVKVILHNKKYSASIYSDGVLVGSFDELDIKYSDKKLVNLIKR